MWACDKQMMKSFFVITRQPVKDNDPLTSGSEVNWIVIRHFVVFWKAK